MNTKQLCSGFDRWREVPKRSLYQMDSRDRCRVAVLSQVIIFKYRALAFDANGAADVEGRHTSSL